MDWKWTPQRVYDRLGLDDPEIFAALVREERRPQIELEYSREARASGEVYERCTGRTTRVLAEAVAFVMNGFTVALRSRTIDLEKYLVRSAEDMLFRVTSPSERGHRVWYERASRLLAWHVVRKQAPSGRFVVLDDHRTAHGTMRKHNLVREERTDASGCPYTVTHLMLPHVKASPSWIYSMEGTQPPTQTLRTPIRGVIVGGRSAYIDPDTVDDSVVVPGPDAAGNDLEDQIENLRGAIRQSISEMVSEYGLTEEVCAEYEDHSITDDMASRLESLGLPVPADHEWVDTDEFVDLVLAYIKLGDPALELEAIPGEEMLQGNFGGDFKVLGNRPERDRKHIGFFGYGLFNT